MGKTSVMMPETRTVSPGARPGNSLCEWNWPPPQCSSSKLNWLGVIVRTGRGMASRAINRARTTTTAIAIATTATTGPGPVRAGGIGVWGAIGGCQGGPGAIDTPEGGGAAMACATKSQLFEEEGLGNGVPSVSLQGGLRRG